MRRIGILMAALLALLVLLCGCGQNGQTIMEQTTTQFVSALEAEGFDSVQAAEAEKSILQGKRMLVTADNEQMSLYIYVSATDAARDAACLSDDGFSYTSKGLLQSSSVCVSWVDVPHFFLYDNAVVCYVGQSQTVLTALRALCGDEVAGGTQTE